MDLNVLSMLHSLSKMGVDPSRIHIFCDKNVSYFLVKFLY